MGTASFEHRSALIAAAISAVCLTTLLLALPTLYIKLNNAHEDLAQRMFTFRVGVLFETTQIMVEILRRNRVLSGRRWL
jgi:hypothetical protein